MKIKDIDNVCVNNLRVLACQMIEKANSGHPGIVLGATPILYNLYAHHLNVSPNLPHILRDRFVLSAGHGSAMLYSILHAFGYNISMEDLKTFRQLNSVCAGHPEREIELGIEATTGPLGQGVSNAVGLAIAEKHLASVFNVKDCKLFDNYTYVLVGDGCLMEGVANEALSLAGTLKLNKLIVIYDYNKITIDGKIDQTFTQNTKQVFEGYGFNVLTVKDGNNLQEINLAIKKAKKSSKPTLIMVNSIIGFGSVLAGTEKVHGSPLGAEIMQKLQDTLNMHTQPFEILPQVKEHLSKLQERFKQVENMWNKKLEYYKLNYPHMYEKLQNYLNNNFDDLESVLKSVTYNKEKLSTRVAGGLVLKALTEKYENIIGGTADLSSSTKTVVSNSQKFSPNTPQGRNIMYGVREFAMSCITNGIAMYGGLVPFASTFFVFSDYCKSGIRSAGLMNLKTLYIFTHDSIGVGEDGPTHQSVEQLTTFRATPNVTVYRPCNLDETKAGFYLALKNNNPTLLILTRQDLLNFKSSFKDAQKGGYIISQEEGKLDVILIATGSEVELCLKAKEKLSKQKIGVRVVSMPSFEIFEMQSNAYKEKVLPASCQKRIAVEAGASLSWYKYVGNNGVIIGVDSFGKSGKIEDVYNYFNITVDNIVKNVNKITKN